MILEIIITILILLVVIFGYTTFNLLRKNEDEKEVFKSDDEIGWFFNEIKIIQNDLSQFRQNQ